VSVADVAAVVAAVASVGGLGTGIYIARYGAKSAEKLETKKWRRSHLVNQIDEVMRAWDNYVSHRLDSTKLWDVFETMDRIEKYGSKKLSKLTIQLRHGWERYDIYSTTMSHEELPPGSSAVKESAAPFVELIEIYEKWKEAAKAELGLDQ
jgi:hypothetical protein